MGWFVRLLATDVWAVAATKGLPRPPRTLTPVDIAADRSGNLYVLELTRVRRFASDGSIHAFTSGFTGGPSIAAGDDGRVYFGPEGAPAGVRAVGCGVVDVTINSNGFLSAMTITTSGGVLVSDSVVSPRVLRLSATGAFEHIAGGGVGDGGPASVACFRAIPV
ncbi:MAG: hypothetical protein SGI92_17730 [Bryobacteraceae bacterium]|nr:hypothetical protein [Bryobacteraceae bacterium]